MSEQLDGKLALVGGGMMAEAILRRVVAQELFPLHKIWVSEPVTARRSYLVDSYGVQVTSVNLDACHEADVVVLAVKPQSFGRVAHDLVGKLKPSALVISIMAGIKIETIADELAHEKIVRAMPNTPAQVGQGMTVWMPTPQVTWSEQETAQLLLSTMGDAFAVEREHYLDMATGLSGSGPGFVFLVIEALIDAGVHIGLSREQSRRMVLQTVEGSVALMRQNGQHPADLRNRVTSPAGTTAAGVRILEERAVRFALIEAVTAAFERSRALGE